MNLIDRIILTLYTFCLALLSIIIIIFSLKLISMDLIWTNIKALYGRWELAIIGFAFLLVSIRFLLSGIRYKTGLETIVRNTSIGQIRISFSAIEASVIRAAKDIAGVKDIKVRILPNKDAVNVILKISVAPDVAIPETADDIQKNIKSYVEKITGIRIEDIKIIIEGIAHEFKNRVI